jgi:uncharacterized RDD family membrane protein YckC
MYCNRCGATNLDTARFCSGCGATFDPAMSGASGFASAAAPAPAFRYAGFWRRFVAMIIDSLVFSPIVVIFVLTSGMFGFLLHPRDDFEGVGAAMFGLSILAFGVVLFAGSWLYHTWMESSRYQATLGKMALGIIVTDLEGRRITFARANGRFFGKWISGMIMNIGYLMAAFTEKKQALHDILAGCLVILK